MGFAELEAEFMISDLFKINPQTTFIASAGHVSTDPPQVELVVINTSTETDS